MRQPGHRTVVVVCRHGKRTVKVATFSRWTGANWYEPALLNGAPLTSQYYDGDGSPVLDTRLPNDRLKLRCKLCSLDLSVRAERLWALLDKADAGGVSEIPLAVLAANLSK